MSKSQFTAAFEMAVADRWILQGEIGRGTQTTVYSAHDAVRGTPVVVKALDASLASALDFPRFRKQMLNAASVQHPGIVPLIAVEEAAGRIFLVTPFLEGESLRTRLNRERQLPLADAIAITRQVAESLGVAHANDILHKDVKPTNIFIDGSRALLMDLGVARAITRSMDETMTGTGLTLGKPGYMSPEHASGGVEISARADLYSLGCVLYEMLAGEPPFTGKQPHAVLMRTLTETPVPVTKHRDGLPPEVGVALDRLLAKDPAGRYASAAEVVEALSGIGNRE
jgi:eukaryotic-like serine/threonine-protein kinase